MSDLPMSMRTDASERHYAEMKTKNQLKQLAEEPSILEFKHWRVIANRFPYDLVLKTHEMLIPKRVVATRDELSMAELIELQDILNTLQHQYDFVMENFARKRSVLYHYHIHLGLYYSNRSEMLEKLGENHG